MGDGFISDKPALSSNLDLGQTVTTVLTPNSTSVANPLNDDSQTVMINFNVRSVTYWATLVSSSILKVMLAADRGCSVVTFKGRSLDPPMDGLTVSFSALGLGKYMVLLDGQIIDDGTVYNISGKPLGIFTTIVQSGSVMRMT